MKILLWNVTRHEPGSEIETTKAPRLKHLEIEHPRNKNDTNDFNNHLQVVELCLFTRGLTKRDRTVVQI